MTKRLIYPLLVALFLGAAGTAFTQTKPLAADIQGIIVETGDGFCFDCERITALHAGGKSAAYHGGKKSRFRRGNFSGDLAAKDFTRLAQTFIDDGFFDLKRRYTGITSDVAAVKITVIYAGGKKTVENFKRAAEPHFKKIETAFNRTADKIVWRAVIKPESNIKPESPRASDEEFSVPCAKALRIGLENVTKLHDADIMRRLDGAPGDSDTELLIEKNAFENYLKCRRADTARSLKKLNADEQQALDQTISVAQRLAEMRVNLIYGVSFDERYDDPVNYVISTNAVILIEDYKTELLGIYLETRDYGADRNTKAADSNIKQIRVLLERIEKLSLESDQTAEFAAFKTAVEKALVGIADEVGNEKRADTGFLVRLLQMNLPPEN